MPNNVLSAEGGGIVIREGWVHTLHAPLSEKIATSFGGLSCRSTALIELESDSRLRGYGESWLNYPPWAEQERLATIREGISPLVIGRDGAQINTLHKHMVDELMPMGIQWGAVGPVMQAISGINLALWDLFCKARGLAVSEVLGGRVRSKIPVYASGLGPDRVEELAIRCRKEGFTAVKARVGFGKEVDVATLGSIRRVMGSDVPLFADANQAWSLRQALDMADELTKYRVSWVEEPIRGNDVVELETFHHKTGIDVATGENIYGLQGFWPYAASAGIGVLQPDVSKTGGISEMAPVCHLAAAAGKPVVPHLYGGPIAQAATLQLASCLEQVEYVEFDVRDNPLCNGLLTQSISAKEGYVEVPEGPGLGVEIDQEALARFSSTRLQFSDEETKEDLR